jgi:AsmA protein
MFLSSLSTAIVFLSITIFILVFVIKLKNDKGKLAYLFNKKMADFLTKNTGRTVNIQDESRFTFYPWLGIDLGKISLANAPGFDEPEFARIDKVKVQIKLLPLLKKHVEIGMVLLEGVTLKLTRKPNGSTNWDDLVKSEPKKAQKELTNLDTLKIQGIDVRYVNIVFDDQKTQSRYTIADLNCKTSPILLNTPIQVQFKTTLDFSNTMPVEGQIDIATEMTIILKNQT